MRNIIVILILASTPIIATAGVGGGGVGPRPEMLTGLTPEIVFNLGDKDGLARFAHGQLINNQWQIQKMEIPKAELLNQQDVVKALLESLRDNQWAEIK